MTMQVFANSSILSTITSIQFAECAGTAPSEGVIPTIRQTWSSYVHQPFLVKYFIRKLDELSSFRTNHLRYLSTRDSILDWIVYILKCADGTLYTGITNDLERRLAQHQSGNGAKYTKGRGPLELVYQECCLDRGFASKRENQIKALGKQAKLLLVSSSAWSLLHLNTTTEALWFPGYNPYYRSISADWPTLLVLACS